MITHTILESIGDAIYSVSADWSVNFFNRQAEQFLARSRTEVLGRSLWQSFPTAHDTELGEALRRVMAERTPINLVTLSPSTDRWADMRIFPVEDGGLAVSWRDVTDQQRQAKALADSNRARQRLIREMRGLADHIPALLAHWGKDLKCLFANASYLEWFGRTEKEMVGLSIRDLMGEALFAENEPYIRGALAGKRQTFERTLTRPDGRVGHTWAQYVPDVDAHGRVRGFFAFVTDISTLKAAEAHLHELNAELDEARAEAEAAAAVKSAFLSNVSHELRNPLTSIIGYADLLAKRSSLAGRELKYLHCIQEASEALLTTVNDVLDFSKLEAGQVEIAQRPIDPVAVGLRALEMFEPDLEKKGLQHGFEASNVPSGVLADDTRLRQILTNLIGNAVKFTVTGRITVRCCYDRSARLLRYEVLDTGLGIPLDRQARLFQRFSQVDASTTRTFGGTGLGLAICKGLTEAMGGAIGVVSVPGEGSCFWVEIPSEPAEVKPPEPQQIGESFDRDALRGLRLLVVDDDPGNRELVRHIVEPFGVVLTEAPGGAEAVSAAGACAFDVILMDIRMPGIDGPTAAQIIRGKPGPNASTPMIAFTADVAGGAPTAWAELFNGLLTKPVAPPELLRRLATARAGARFEGGEAPEAPRDLHWSGPRERPFRSVRRPQLS